MEKEDLKTIVFIMVFAVFIVFTGEFWMRVFEILFTGFFAFTFVMLFIIAIGIAIYFAVSYVRNINVKKRYKPRRRYRY
jgi:apolipoprotein N-acyltransferase